MTIGATQPLQREEQLFVQRLLACHVMDDKTAQKVYKQGKDNHHLNNNNNKNKKRPTNNNNNIENNNDDNENNNDGENMNDNTMNDDNNMYQNYSLEESLGRINQQMSKGFGMEIVTVVLNKVRYHAIINLHADDVSKLSEHYNPHERAYILLVLQHLVSPLHNHENENNDNENNDEDENAASPSTASRSTLINLRGDLQEPLSLSLKGAEHVIEMLLEEQWIQISNGGSGGKSNKRNSAGRRKSSDDSMQAELELAPRTYLELSHLLVDMGMSQDDLPQFLFHRM